MKLFVKKKNEPAAKTVEITGPVTLGHFEDMSFKADPVKTPEEIDAEKWEQRRWELVRYLVSQDRRSVVLGKLQASPKTIASKARELADATINELLNNPRSFNNGKRTDATTE